MPKSSNLRKTLALVLAFVLTACSADSPQTEGAASGTSSVTKYYACDFLNASAISSQLGMPFGEGRKTNESGGGKNQSHMTTCTWEAQDNGGASSADPLRDRSAVILMLWSYRDAQLGKEYLESFREVAQETGGPAPTPISLGDEALLDGTNVHVRKGNAAFTVTVQVHEMEQAAAGKHAEALAKQVAARL